MTFFFSSVDSVYTERYMKTPLLNPQGYIDSAVNNMTGFKDTKYLLAHGTGDDNGKKEKSQTKGIFQLIMKHSSFPTHCCFG